MNNISYLAETNFRGSTTPFGIKQADRRQHLYCVGKTGSGKTTLLKNLLIQDIEAGRGVALIDPHGDLARELLDYIPRRRTEEVIYFNPADRDHPVGFNLLEKVAPEGRHLATSSVVSAFKSIWADSWGPRLEYILYNAVAALLEDETATLLGVPKLLTDERYRARVVERVHDPIVRRFWENEFERYPERLRQEAIAPVQNKVGQFLTAAPIRNILGQVKSKVDLSLVMSRRQIFIANLSKGEIGEEQANLLGSLLVAKFQLAATGRATIPEVRRKDFHLYIDEFQNFTTTAFASILSEARKYRLCLTLAHQYIDQLPDDVKKAVFGNVGTLISFRVGARDARVLEPEFSPKVTASDLVGLERYSTYLKLMIDGVGSQPFSATTVAPQGKRHGRGEIVVKRSRERFARPRLEVEGKIERWLRH